MFQITELQIGLLQVCLIGGGGFYLALPDYAVDAENKAELLKTNMQADDLVDEDLLVINGTCTATARGWSGRMFEITDLGRKMFSGQSAGTSAPSIQ